MITSCLIVIIKTWIVYHQYFFVCDCWYHNLDLHLKHKAVDDVFVAIVQISQLVRLQVLQGEHPSKHWKSKVKAQMVNLNISKSRTIKSYCQINQRLHWPTYEISSLWKVIQPSLAAFAKGEVAMSGQLNQMEEDPTLGRSQSHWTSDKHFLFYHRGRPFP